MASFPGRLEVALGADRTANSFTWTYTNITADVAQDTAVIAGGRPANAVLPDPGSFPFVLNNSDGRYTPGLPTSTHYPDWGRGVPVRYSVPGGSPCLLLTGAASCRAGTPDAASLDITGDLYVAVEVCAPASLPPPSGSYEVTGKFNVTGNQRSYVLWLFDGCPRLRWSTDGTGAGELNAASTVALQQPSAGPYTFAAHLDVNNGAGGRTTTFYAIRGTLADLRAAITLGLTSVVLDTVTDTGTTSIFASTAPFDIGDVTGSGFSPYPGQIRAVELRAGDHTGTVAANPDFTIQTPGATSFADTAAVPKTWTITSPAAISNQQIRFVGEITSIQPRWPGNGTTGTGQVQVTASGVLKRLRQGEEPLRSALYRRVTDARNIDDVGAYWPMEDGTDATRFASAIPGAATMSYTGLSLASDQHIAASAPLPSVSAGQTATFAAKVPSTLPTTDWAVEAFVYMPTPEANPTTTRLLAINTTGTPIVRWAVSVNDTNINVTGRDADSTAIVNSNVASDDRFFAQPTYIRFDFTQSGGNIDWSFTWVPLDRSGVAFGGGSGTTAGTLGRPSRILNSLAGPPDGFTIGHIIIQSGLELGWLAQAETGFDGETATARIERLCGEEDVPVAIHGALTEGVTLGPQRPIGFTALIEEAAAADQGILAEQRGQLGLHYRNHNSLLNQDPQLSISSGLIQPFEPAEDDQDLRNDITAQRPGGSSATEVDQDSIDSDGRYADSVSVNVETDEQLPSQAGWRVHVATWPEMRLRALTLELAKASSLIDPWLDTALGDIVEVTDPPANYPTETTAQLMTGYTETIRAQLWSLVLSTTPAGPWTVGVLDTSGTPDTSLARLTTTASALAGSLSSGATGATSVNVTDGPLWTTDATHFPLDILIDGERITLSAISGAASPQTFTISVRAVNGIVKAHSAGAAVQVADPFILAL